MTNVLPLGLAVAAALSFGVGMALEHRGASGAPSRVNAHPGLLKDLLKSSHWRLGLIVTGAGYVLQAIAFGTGRLVIIEPIMTLALVVALAAGGLIDHRPLTRHQWLVVGATTAAVLVFTATTAPDRGVNAAPIGTWVPWLIGIGIATLLVVLLSSHWAPRRRAGALALVAGCMYGVTDALTKSVTDGLGRHGIHILTTWEPYALVAVGATAFMAQQTAYHASRLADAQPALSVTEPIVGSAIGITVLQEHVHLTTITDFVDGVAVIVMLVGIVALGRLADRECESPAETMEPAPATAAAGTAVAEAIRADKAEKAEHRLDRRASGSTGEGPGRGPWRPDDEPAYPGGWRPDAAGHHRAASSHPGTTGTTSPGTPGAGTAEQPRTTSPGTAEHPGTTSPGTTSPGTTSPGTAEHPGTTSPGTAKTAAAAGRQRRAGEDEGESEPPAWARLGRRTLARLGWRNRVSAWQGTDSDGS